LAFLVSIIAPILLSWLFADVSFFLAAEVVREKVQDGETGETREISYTQCKIVGNGSFGVVFQTRMMPSGEDAAIKRVLQDKRFKVGTVDFASAVVAKHSAEP